MCNKFNVEKIEMRYICILFFVCELNYKVLTIIVLCAFDKRRQRTEIVF